MADLWRDAPLVGGEDWRSAPLMDAGRFDEANSPTDQSMPALPEGATVNDFLDAAKRHDYLANLQSDLETRAAARRVHDDQAGAYDYGKVALETGRRLVGGAADFLGHLPSMVVHTPEAMTKAAATVGSAADEETRKVRVGGDTYGFDMNIPAEGTTGATAGDFINELLMLSGVKSPKASVGSIIGGELPKAEPFFSQLEKTVEHSPTTKAPAAQWKATLANAAGVKAEEIDWTGVNDWLTAQEAAGTPVTREALLGEVKAHRVQLGESLRGSGPDLTSIHERMAAADEAYHASVRHLDRTVADFHREGGRGNAGDATVRAMQEAETLRDDAASRSRDIRRELDGITKGSATRFSEYQIPGGENYKELVVTTPVDSPATMKIGNEIATLNKSLREKYGERWRVEAPREALPEIHQLERHENELDRLAGEDRRNAYTSPHWPGETNPLLHVRFNDRVDATGQRVLHLEEIQSDWGQAIRAEREKIKEALNRDFDGIADRMVKAGEIIKECD